MVTLLTSSSSSCSSSLPSGYVQDNTYKTKDISNSSTMELGNLIAKLVQTVLKSRLGTDYYCVQPHELCTHCCLSITPHTLPASVVTEGYELALRIVYGHTLLERWIIKFSPTLGQQKETEETDIRLLLQSAYTYTRHLPLHSLLTQSRLTKRDLGFVMTDSSSTSSLPCFCSSFPMHRDNNNSGDDINQFSSQASVSTHTFSMANCIDVEGQLSLQVMYDEKVSQLSTTAMIPIITSTLPNENDHNNNRQSGTDVVIPTSSMYSVKPNPPGQQQLPMKYQFHVPLPTKSNSVIGARRLSRLSLSAMSDISSALDDHADNNENEVRHYQHEQLSLSIPMSTSPIQYTHHGHTMAYSTSPSTVYQRRSSLPLNTLHPHHHPQHGLTSGYEDSLVNGRPFGSQRTWFHAQIGVLGHGRVKASLKCPPHLSVTFPACFYDNKQHDKNQWINGVPFGASSFIEAPTTRIEEPFHPIPLHVKTATALLPSTTSSLPPYMGTIDLTMDQDKPSLGYRIPSKGQLQIAIKHTNKSLAKLFLVSYDVSNMPRNAKTFLRQKSYARLSPSSPSSSSTLLVSPLPSTLKHVIHLQLCRTNKNRVYLYQQIHVVFANQSPSREQYETVCEVPDTLLYTPL